jgi:uncharacterized protein (DUF1697 family)
MTRYVALLKGVNVGRRKRIAMSDLRSLLTGLGYADVATYLASGNALFTTPSRRPVASLASEMEERITAELGMVVRVIVRTAGELAGVTARNPLAAEPENAAAIEKRLGVAVTTRTWNTVTKLVQITSG